MVILGAKAFLFHVNWIISRNENSSASEHVRKDQFGSKKIDRVKVGKSRRERERAENSE